MSRIPQHFIDELIARADVVEVVGSRVPLKKAGHEFKACCPFHDEKTPSFTVSPAKQFYHCFGCGAHGTALGFLMEYDHMSFVDAVEALAEMLGLEVPREGGGPPERSHADLLEVLERAGSFFRSALKDSEAAVDYLRGRGLDGQIAATFGIGYAPRGWDNLIDHLGRDEDTMRRMKVAGLVIEKDGGGAYDRFRDRVMFPIRDGRGRTVGFGGRVLDGSEPKYLNSPETPLFHKGRELYGLYEARKAQRDIPWLMVVEGYMDVVGLSQAGITAAVATLGTATTEEHLRRLFRITERVIFCFDGDRAGRKAAWRALETALPALGEGHRVDFLFLPEGEDPDSLVRQEGSEAFQGRIEAATPLSEFMVAGLGERTDMATVDGRARLAELARPLLARVPEGVYRDLLVDHVARTVGLDAGRLESHIPVTDPRRPGARKPARPGSAAPARRSTLMRDTIALLLAHPGAAARTEVPDALETRDGAGAPLLRELLAVLGEAPGLTTAGVLERWRDRPEHAHLMKLAAAESLTEDEAAATVLADMLKALADRETRQRRADDLLAKAQQGELEAAEKEELRRLLARDGDSS